MLSMGESASVSQLLIAWGRGDAAGLDPNKTLRME